MDHIPREQRGVSILIPVFNEAKTIHATLDELYTKCFWQLSDFELLMLEDGSTDNTASVLHNCEGQYRNLHAITEPRRLGYRTMVTRGILMARKDWILLLDGDGQIEPTDIHLLLDCPTDYDIITAIKFPRCDPIFRILTSRLFDVWSDLLLGISVHDINFGLKLMRTSMAHKLVPQCGRLGEIFTAELVIRFVYAGCRLHQVQTRHRRRLTGKSTGIPPPRLLGRSLYTLIGLFSLRRELITRQFVQPPPEER